ncbi:MAG: hypothetical protein ACXVB1_02360 [Pseudobdellovibrionaceae bacterium]
MLFQGIFFSLVLLSFIGCASAPSSLQKAEMKSEAKQETAVAPLDLESSASSPEKKSDSLYLICKASRHRFHYDWSAGALEKGHEGIDQNHVRYKFRSAKKPAGKRGENLKVGECGWEERVLVGLEKSSKSQVIFKSLSDEATQSFYRMKTGKVFKFPVRPTKSGLMAISHDIKVIR